MNKKIITISDIILIIIILLILIFPIIYFGFTLGTDSKELIESVKSPNKKYTINTYLTNCGATCDFGVVANESIKSFSLPDNQLTFIYDTINMHHFLLRI